MTVHSAIARGYALERCPPHLARCWYVLYRECIVARCATLPDALAELIAWAAL